MHFSTLFPMELRINAIYVTRVFQITKQGMSSRVVDEQNVEKQFTSSEIVSNTDNMEMVPPATDSLESCGWKDVSCLS